jgi:spermidine synthase
MRKLAVQLPILAKDLMVVKKYDAFGDEYNVIEVVINKLTPYQHMEILDVVTYGRCLFLDNVIQSAESDEYLYHESMVHPAMVVHPNPQKVLIMGGGEGSILREVLRHNTVKQVVMVDVDEEVVRACQEHLAPWNQGAFDDPRSEVVYAEGREFLDQAQEVWDIIIVDVTDPLKDGPSYRLFTLEFYQLVSQRVSNDGILVVSGQSIDSSELDTHLAIFRTLSEVFPSVRTHCVRIPSFDEAWAFVMASKKSTLRLLTPREVDRTMASRGCAGVRFYNGAEHISLLTLPNYLRLAQAAQGPIITDDQPIFIKSGNGS